MFIQLLYSAMTGNCSARLRVLANSLRVVSAVRRIPPFGYVIICQYCMNSDTSIISRHTFSKRVCKPAKTKSKVVFQAKRILFKWIKANGVQSLALFFFTISFNYTVLQKYAHIGLKQNLLRSITLDIITRLLDNAAFVCTHVVERFSKDFSEVRGSRS